MKLTAKVSLVVLVALVLTLGTEKIVRSHCEIPCGVYGDTTRIDLLYEDILTVEKSMQQIMELSKASLPANMNQLVRWVGNKEEHANKIQHAVTQYFMTQRVKPKPASDAGYKQYLTQLTSLHEMLIAAMKAKQTTDLGQTKELRRLVDQFAAAYFTAEDLEHIRSHHGKHSD
jgi:nickel superoxide dismutase